MNKENMIKALEKKVKEIVEHFEDKHIEIRNFDYSVLDKAVSLVEDIFYYLDRTRCAENYKFIYRFVFPLNGGRVITSVVNLSITGKKFAHTFHHVGYLTTSSKLHSFIFPLSDPFAFTKGMGSLFVMIYDGNLRCELFELEEIRKKLAIREKLLLATEYETGFGYVNPFPKAYRGLEIPFNVEVIEYIL